MLGWHISIFRQDPPSTQPAPLQEEYGERVKVWQSRLGGCKWLDDLVEAGHAHMLALNGGYPIIYTLRYAEAAPFIADPPHANAVWRHNPGDILTDKWDGKTTTNERVLAEVSDDEWLVAIVWDES